jgi:hypothetical protein
MGSLIANPLESKPTDGALLTGLQSVSSDAESPLMQGGEP